MKRASLVAAILTIFQVLGGSLSFAQRAASTAIVGGRGGSEFSDPEPPAGTRVLEVHIRSGDHVDSVQMLLAYPDGRTAMSPRRGGSGGRLDVFRLDSDEYISGVSGRNGDYIDSISLRTNKRTSPIYGGPGGNRDFRLEVPSGNQAVGFSGRAGNLLDAVGLILAPLSLMGIQQTAIAGGRGGSVFSDTEIPSGARITEVRVHSGEFIDSIQAIYVLPNGGLWEGRRYGGEGGHGSVFRLDSDEYITGLSGRYGDAIDSLRVHTNRRTSPLFGGRGGNRDFRIDVPAGSQAVGFAGRAGQYLDAIGLAYSEISTSRRRRRR